MKSGIELTSFHWSKWQNNRNRTVKSVSVNDQQGGYNEKSKREVHNKFCYVPISCVLFGIGQVIELVKLLPSLEFLLPVASLRMYQLAESVF